MDYQKIWKSELKKNPHLFKTKILTQHKTREEAYLQENKFQKHLNVAESSLYINMKIANETFTNHGRKFPKEYRERVSKRLRGVPRSKEFCENHSKRMAGNTNTLGWKWITNGIENKLVDPQTLLENGWRFGRMRSEQWNRKIGEGNKGKVVSELTKSKISNTLKSKKLDIL